MFSTPLNIEWMSGWHWFLGALGLFSSLIHGICFNSVPLFSLTGEGNGTHSSPLAWRVPWTEEPGGLQSMGSQRVGHDWATSLSLFTFCIGEGNGSPLQRSCLENPRDGGAWWAPIYGVAQSRTRLKWLSSSSSSFSLTGLTRSALSQALCFCFSNNLTHLLGF